MLRIVTLLFFCSVMISPLYIFPSGLPQPSDMVMGLAFFIAILGAIISRKDLAFSLLPRSIYMLVIWIVVVNVCWGIYYSSEEFLMDPIFWVYNLLVSVITIYILKEFKGGGKLITLAILLSLLVSAVGAVLGLKDISGRNTGFFNNPNQLAYFSICATACLIVLNDFKFSSLYVVIGCVLGGVGVLSAASLGALAGSLGLLAALFLANIKKASSMIFLPILLIVFSLAIATVDSYSDGRISSILDTRFERSGSKVDNIYTERNYHRIVYFPEHIILGAGSALHPDRFYPYGRQEIHSSFGTLLFNYGILGLFLFLYYLFSILRKARLQYFLVASAPLIYSLTHLGLRFTIFWILLAVIFYKVKLLKDD